MAEFQGRRQEEVDDGELGKGLDFGGGEAGVFLSIDQQDRVEPFPRQSGEDDEPDLVGLDEFGV